MPSTAPECEALTDHLVGCHQQGCRESQAERPRCLEIDGHLVPGRCLHRKVDRPVASKDAVDIGRRQPEHGVLVGPIRHETSGGDKHMERVDRGQPVLSRECDDQIAMGDGAAAGRPPFGTREQLDASVRCRRRSRCDWEPFRSRATMPRLLLIARNSQRPWCCSSPAKATSPRSLDLAGPSDGARLMQARGAAPGRARLARGSSTDGSDMDDTDGDRTSSASM